MCGICGVVAARMDEQPDPLQVERAADMLRHRGPDHGRTRSLGPCVLGYRRLRVIDLETGDQPVTDESGEVVVVFNGEIYNYRELRHDLQARGHRLEGQGDTAVLPHLYEEHGDRFAERLDGMFAIAVWDGRRGRLVLARDRVGKKPLLYVKRPDGSLAFASELKALLAFMSGAHRVDLARLDEYLALGYVPGTESAIRGVCRLPPGSLLTVQDGELAVERYWRPIPGRAARTTPEWIEAVRDGVISAVRKRLVADVPLGALLSGGIDSSVVVAAMASAGSGSIRTFSVGFSEALYDERPYARAVAARFGTTHEELLVEPDVAAVLPRLADTFDEPFADSSALPTFLVCEHARRFVTVALVGDGGDEIFGGYERYRAHALASRLRHVPNRWAAIAAQAVRSLSPGPPEARSRATRAARFLDTAGLDAGERYGRLMHIFDLRQRTALWSDSAHREIGSMQSAGAMLGEPKIAGVTGLQLLDIETYLPSDLLFKADLASMAHSLELRAPLLDHHLAELALGLPDELKMRGRLGKVALRRAFADDLPREILDRGKRGFGVPIGRWLRQELREIASDVLLGERSLGRGYFRREVIERLISDHAAGRADHGARIWSLLMLELWLERTVTGSA
jgi:asparagine synthase (glutamine-hydrolysing)